MTSTTFAGNLFPCNLMRKPCGYRRLRCRAGHHRVWWRRRTRRNTPDASMGLTAQSAGIAGVMLAQQVRVECSLAAGRGACNRQHGHQRWLRERDVALGELGERERGLGAGELRHLGTGRGHRRGRRGPDRAGIEPGTTYRLTARARVSAASDTIYVGVNFVDSAGEPVKQDATPITSTAYTTASLEVVAPPGAVNAVIYVWKNAGAGLGYVDDSISAWPAAPARAPRLRATSSPTEHSTTALRAGTTGGNTITSTASGSSAAQVGTAAGGFGQLIGAVVPGKQLSPHRASEGEQRQ